MKRPLPACVDGLVSEALDAQQAFVFFSLPPPNLQLPAGVLSNCGGKKSYILEEPLKWQCGIMGLFFPSPSQTAVNHLGVSGIMW